ncbi:glycoside hydrolase family 32 protein [Vagococcus vulneris]|uniref:Sucrose-6-phosphate hydrolase n=1 Tax=Vagococcus vulneris TaxID=1977869 RepID=A0A429ZSN0_9ENTE|nr:sucrose-6-phosphate hydrolase [Vagococcus vulneris]RST96732.1 hypothetical protein CBF37_10750 [Vagococcus vulneris]
MDWTREQRYRSYNSADKTELDNLLATTKNSKWRQVFHIQPIHGLLNDPNGFTWFNGAYHLFYQWFPLGPVHGLKHWYHLTSVNLVDWTDQGLALTPDLDHDAQGIFSGTGFVNEKSLYLFYTGNKRDANWNREASQCLAIMDESGTIKKNQQPLIPKPPKGYTMNFRDPKVFKRGGIYYMFVGGQRENMTGCILVYTSNDLVDWKFVSELKTNHSNFGFMWECPDLFSLDHEDVLLLSPQGLTPGDNEFENIYNSGVFIGTFNQKDISFDTSRFQELDRGFDFYAPQTTKTPDGRTILIGWMGLPDIDYPSDQDNWSGCLTIPRELRIENRRVLQKPILELKEKRTIECNESYHALDGYQLFKDISSHVGEYQMRLVSGDAVKTTINFYDSGDEKTSFFIDWQHQMIGLDRRKSGYQVASEYGEIRSAFYQHEEIELQIFLDTSSIEIFVNDGELVFTSRIFPTKWSRNISIESEGEVSAVVEQWPYQE